MIIRDIKIREIFSHNLKKTIEVEIKTSKGISRASVPIGTSRGKNEVVYLDSDKVVTKFLEIKEKFEMKEFKDVFEIDQTLKEIDGSENFSNIGGNLALGISLAAIKSFALYEGKKPFEYLSEISGFDPKMPKPVSNVIGGGKHGGKTDFQEFLLIDLHMEDFLETISKIADAYYKISKILVEKDPLFTFGRNLESAWITNLSLKEILDLLKGISKEYQLTLGIDFAASELWDGENYVYHHPESKLTRVEQLIYIAKLAEENNIYYLEDPFDQEDFVSFSALTNRLPRKLIVGDDLYCTNPKRLEKGIKFKASNGIIVKPNQVGTISDVIEVVKLAKKNDIKTIVSHRSGETEDPVLAHIAVGLGSDFIKLGIAGERTVKVNELLRINEYLSSIA